ncbi:MAG TPA: DJ-1/PfpI family protein [Methylotenera sp.]|nr:DJ-1/PfpI family protein [Methylotenera sp.]HPH06279.1 DJ-1/PfpI family protein [Methylotenera sp.]HPN00375.1 DJ-1/PfpI family protein [Methylotenera sp.]
MNRRKFIQLASSSGAALALAKLAKASTDEPTKVAAEVTREEKQHSEAMNKYAEFTGGDKLIIGMLVYPGMFLQDLVGPLTVFEALMNRDIHLVWKNLDEVGNENPAQTKLIPIRPTTSFKDCPKNLDVLFVPGGVPGTLTMMEDPEVLSFLAEQGKSAKFITSVCTGSLILGAAGLLRGYNATSYWSSLPALAELGAIPTKSRVVVDRNRVTGGGVTAGIDFGLKLVALLRNENYAKAVQLYIEYNPEPPFNAGSPETAPPIVTQFLNEMFAGINESSIQTARRAKKRFS